MTGAAALLVGAGGGLLIGVSAADDVPSNMTLEGVIEGKLTTSHRDMWSDGRLHGGDPGCIDVDDQTEPACSIFLMPRGSTVEPGDKVEVLEVFIDPPGKPTAANSFLLLNPRDPVK